MKTTLSSAPRHRQERFRIAGALFGAETAGELRFRQVVDPLKTVRFEFPRRLRAQYGFTLL